MLNSTGFYLTFGNNQTDRPSFLNGLTPPPPVRYRFRLMEFLQASENFLVYTMNFPGGSSHDWFTKNTGGSSLLLAENVLALIVLPRLPSDPPDASSLMPGNDYEYDSQVAWKSGNTRSPRS